MFDIAIVGAGPAGLSAAVTARQRGLEVLVISRKDARGWLARAERIDNYPGLTSFRFDQDHTVRRLSPIQRRGRSPFQDTQTLYIIRI